LDEQFFTTANGAPSYIDDAYLNQAGVVILQKSNNLVSILEADSRFQLVYQDQLAAVFVRSGPR
jgi:acyl-CoA synthetase (NDP forming)